MPPQPIAPAPSPAADAATNAATKAAAVAEQQGVEEKFKLLAAEIETLSRRPTNCS